MLKPETVADLHRAVTTTGLNRTALFSSIDPMIAAQIPVGSTPGDQTLLDITFLDRLAETDGGSSLVDYLRSAILLSSLRREQAVFVAARAELEDCPGSTPPPHAVDAGDQVWARDRVRCALLSCIADDATLQRMELHLAPLRMSGHLDLWHRGLTPPGADAEGVAASRLGQADLVLVLLSADFLASSTLMRDAALALERQMREASPRVFPILVRRCDLTMTPFHGLAMLPRSGQALSQEASPDDTYLDIAVAVRRAVEQLLSLRRAEPR